MMLSFAIQPELATQLFEREYREFKSLILRFS